MKLFAVLVSLLTFVSCTSTEKIYVGTGSPDGMFLVELNEKDGSLTKLYQQNDVKGPGFLTFSPDKKFLYCVASGNKIRAYKIEADGSLKFLNEKSSTGNGPCHIEASKSGKSVVVANYGSGDTTVVSVGADGSLSGEARNHSHKNFDAPSPSNRQEGPHAHNVYMSPDGKYCFVSDLGLDKIVTYKFDENFEKLTLNNPQFAKVPTGSGPRHFTFHKNQRFAYVINELNSTVSAFHYAGNGRLQIRQTISTKKVGLTTDNNCADIHIHPNGKFLYGSNRGHNNIVIYKIKDDGTLDLVGHESTRGDWPRNFAISPSGDFLLVANRRTNDIQVFKIDSETGKLTHTGNSLSLPAPICLKFISK
ncbi:MAG: lactonase family protein [Lentisphaeraceae bacterium]|nr:lactonase family protein [Lentisphaeraceae bacterium]